MKTKKSISLILAVLLTAQPVFTYAGGAPIDKENHQLMPESDPNQKAILDELVGSKNAQLTALGRRIEPEQPSTVIESLADIIGAIRAQTKQVISPSSLLYQQPNDIVIHDISFYMNAYQQEYSNPPQEQSGVGNIMIHEPVTEQIQVGASIFTVWTFISTQTVIQEQLGPGYTVVVESAPNRPSLVDISAVVDLPQGEIKAISYDDQGDVVADLRITVSGGTSGNSFDITGTDASALYEVFSDILHQNKDQVFVGTSPVIVVMVRATFGEIKEKEYHFELDGKFWKLDLQGDKPVLTEEVSPAIQRVNQTAKLLQSTWDVNSDGRVDSLDLDQIETAAHLYRNLGLTNQTSFSDSVKEIYGRTSLENGYLLALIRDLRTMMNSDNSPTERKNAAVGLADGIFDHIPPGLQDAAANVLVAEFIKLAEERYLTSVSNFNEKDFLKRLTEFIRKHPQDSFYAQVGSFLTGTVLRAFEGESPEQFEQRASYVLTLWNQHHLLVFYPPNAIEPKSEFNVYDSHLNMLGKLLELYATDYPPYREEVSVILFTKDVFQACGSTGCPDALGPNDYLASVFPHEMTHEIQNSQPLVRQAFYDRFVRLYNASLEYGDFVTSYHTFAEEDFAELVSSWVLDTEGLLRRGLTRALQGSTLFLEKLLFWDSLNPVKSNSELVVYSLSNEIEVTPIIKRSIPITRDDSGRIVRIELDGKVYAIGYNSEGVNQVSLTEELSPAVQAYIQNIQNTVASGYIVTIQKSETDPSIFQVTINAQSTVVEGAVRSIAYNIKSLDGLSFSVEERSIQVVIAGGYQEEDITDLNGRAFYRGLIHLSSSPDPIVALTRINLYSAQKFEYYFALDGTYWKITYASAFFNATLTQALPPQLQTYVQDFQNQLEPGYQVVARPSPTNSIFPQITVTYVGDVPKGRLRSISYNLGRIRPENINGSAPISIVISGGTGSDRIFDDELGKALFFNFNTSWLRKSPLAFDARSVVVALSRGILEEINSNDYSFSLDGKYWRIHLETMNGEPRVTMTQEISPAVQSYVQNLQDQVGPDYRVEAKLGLGGASVDVTITVVGSGLGDGRVKAISYQINPQTINQPSSSSVINVLRPGKSVSINGLAVYQAISTIAGQTNPLVFISRMTFGVLNENEYHFMTADGLYYRINFTGSPVGVVSNVTLTQELSPAAQAYVQDVQTQLGAEYTVVGEPSAENPEVSVINVNFMGTVTRGELQSLNYRVRTSGAGVITVRGDDVTADFAELDQQFDGFIYDALAQLPGNPDPIIIFSRLTFLSLDGRRGYFELDGSYWRITSAQVNGKQRPVLTLETPELARAYYLEEIQDQFGSDYEATIRVSTTDPTKFTVTVTAKPGVTVANDRVKSLTYTAQFLEDHTFRVFESSVRVTAQGVHTLNGEAVYRGLALLSGGVDPIIKLSQISLGYISASQYRFVDTGKFWDISFSFTQAGGIQTQTIKSVTLTEVLIPANVQLYIQNLQTQVGSSIVTVSPTLNTSYEYAVTLTVQGNVPEGRLKSLSYRVTTNLSGVVRVLIQGMKAVISGGANPDITKLDASIIFIGLRKLPGNPDPIVSFSRATFTSPGNSNVRYDFVLNGYSWTIELAQPNIFGFFSGIVNLTYNPPAHIQSRLNEIRLGLGNRYRVTVLPTYPDPSTIPNYTSFHTSYIGASEAPTSFFTIKAEAMDPEVIGYGRLKSLAYNAFSRNSSTQLTFTNTIQVVFRGLSRNAADLTQISGRVLEEGLSHLPNVSNPFTVMDKIVINSVSATKIQFTRNNILYRIREVNRIVTLSRRTVLGRGFTWVDLK